MDIYTVNGYRKGFGSILTPNKIAFNPWKGIHGKEAGKLRKTIISYMALPLIDNLVEKFKKYYSAELPMAVVYYDGYPEKSGC